MPGTAIAIALAAWRLGPTRARSAGYALLAGGAALALPLLFWLLFTNNALQGDANPTATTGSVAAVEGVDLRKELSYVWQFYLPRLPFMDDLFGVYPLWEVYFQGFVGRFGHFFFDFPQWVNWLALVLASPSSGSPGERCGCTARRCAPRLPELVAYLALLGGLLVLLGVAGFQFREREGYAFEQTRYLLPLLPLYAGLSPWPRAAPGAGRGTWRWRSWRWPAGAEPFAVLLSISHYYA